MTKVYVILTNFIDKFINENGSEDVIKLWNEGGKKSFVKLSEKELKKTEGTSKKKKSVNAPKGARSAYIIFCIDARPIINEEFPESSNQEKMKLMGEKWNELKENDKEKFEHYQKLAREDKERATKEKENYIPIPEENDEELEEKAPKKTAKRTKTGYQLFCENERNLVKHEGFTGKDITSELSKRWKNLQENDEDMYTEYLEKAKKLKIKK